MKIASLVSGLLIITLLIMFFTGVIDFNNNVLASLVEGNHAYAANNYDKALEAYKKGLNENSEDPKLNYNSGQASYRLNKFEDAVKYYVKTSDTPDKYINSGNSSLKMAESIDDEAQKQQYYQQALETYKQGILAFPENLPLKYNYEYVKNKLGDQQNNNNDDQNNQDQQNQDKNDQNNQDQQGQDKDNQNQSNQDENSEQNNQSEQDKQNGNSEQQDNKGQNQENKENQQSSQTDQDKEQDNAQAGDKEEEKDKKNASQAQESDSTNSEQEDNNIAQILRMLERQEEDSLKNNQEIKSKAKGDEYDW